MKLGKWMFWRPDERRVLMLGFDYAGKTTLLYRWVLDEPITAIPTIGFNVETIKHPGGYAFQVWDVGGWLGSSECLIYMHNCSEMERLDEQVGVLKTVITDDEMLAVPVLVVLNVQDLMQPAAKAEHMAKILAAYAELIATCRRPGSIRIFNQPGFSAKTAENPRIILDEVVKMLEDQNGGAAALPAKKKTDAENANPTALALDAERVKTMVEADSMTTDGFWQAFEDGSLAPWDHYNHLKAGFFVLMEAFEQGCGVLEAAETFIGHLERLRAGNPQRFRNTTHRTMTIFWLAQLHVAAANYINTLNTKRALRRDDFKDVLLHSPQLTDARLWSTYYSKAILFAKEPRERWCLPDLKPLPSVAVTAAKRRQKPGQPPAAVGVADRLISFGLTVVQQTLTSKARRGPIVKAALAALESSTMRERAVTAAIPPYSETQAYFWVQMVHAAIATAASPENAAKREDEKHEWSGSVEALTLPAFKALYSITGDEWRAHYSTKLWESLGARMQFCPPDRKPLPNVVAVFDKTGVSEARGVMVEKQVSESEPGDAELPLAKDLAVMAAVLAQEVVDGSSSGHGAMMQSLFEVMHSKATDEEEREQVASRKRRSRAIAAALEVPCPGIDGLTQRVFWVQQMLLAVGGLDGGANFGDFIRTNAHLAYKDLALVYYSPMLWASEEAKAVYIAPDRKALSSLVS
ncbi:ARF-like GTPase ARLP2 [Cordyceps fumosorosea ARSEF 2679]|uniref:ARF-like GTPase ARLP2 n=1 Tax=Cordyceps fumosorosea (strain ARSEF 2679) TaxID=1081104 RepID=A0A167R0W2_CORFA|nr:ARF-like GTPase ARLP2 [Cordyceps fumosorosea ARSEF 2679]OAA58168.1 ARF-like GTPase ARLP2 [Cordyceps fumosorosea ARSEF 2679]